MKVLHLVTRYPANDFVVKDMKYSKKIAGVDTCLASAGWSGRRYLPQSLLSLLRMILSGILLRASKADVIHAHFIVSSFTAKLSGKPVVLTMHDSHAGLPSLWRALFTLTARRCNIIYVSQYNRAYWAPILKNEGFVQYHGIDMEEFNPSKRDDRYNEEIKKQLGVDHLVTSMGGLEPRRGMHLVVIAVGLLRKMGINAGVVLKGYGGNANYEAKVNKLAEQLGVPLLIITRFLSDSDLIRLIASSDAFVRPTSVESFGLAVLEAEACGVPTVVCDCCSLKEVFADSTLKFELGNAESLASQLRSLFTNSDLYSELAERGVRHARSLSWELKIKGYLAMYNKAISGT